MTVKDYAGKPVQAEVSLALVDKAVLALAPDNSGPILTTFYPERALSVVTSLGIVLSADDFNENYRKSIADGLAGGQWWRRERRGGSGCDDHSPGFPRYCLSTKRRWKPTEADRPLSP